MREEEKKAIVRAREHLTNPAGNYLSDREIEILLDLIDKQKEEIRKLKLITNTYNSYEEKDMNHTKIIIADSEYFMNGTFVNKFISKDKIRKIIKELSNQNYNNYELSVALRKSLEILLED